MKENRLQAVALAAVLVIALFARCYDLGGESIWLDEMFSLKLSQLPVKSILDECARDVHPPLYFLMLKPWIALFGASESALRAPSVIFGLLSVFFLFLVGKRLFGAETGLLAALILGLSVFNVHYSQEGRGYSLMAFLSLASWESLLSFLERRKASCLILYGLCIALLPWTHFLGALIPLSQACFLGLRAIRTREIKPLLILFPVMALAALLFLPWVSILRQQVASVSADFWIPRPAGRRAGVTFLEFSGPIPLLPVFGWLACLAVYRIRRTEAAALLSCWLGIPLAAAYVISLVSVPVYTNKALIGASPAFFLLAAQGLSALRRPRLRSAVLLLIVIGSLFALGDYYRKTNKEPWREAAAALKGRILESDAVLFYAGYMRESFEHYYGPIRAEVVQTRFAGGPLTEGDVRESLSRAEGRERVWLILCHTGGFEGLIRSTLEGPRVRAGVLKFPVWKFHLPVKYDVIQIELFQSPGAAGKE